MKTLAIITLIGFLYGVVELKNDFTNAVARHHDSIESAINLK